MCGSSQIALALMPCKPANDRTHLVYNLTDDPPLTPLP
jgi:hypothetical protein